MFRAVSIVILTFESVPAYIVLSLSSVKFVIKALAEEDRKLMDLEEK